MSHEFPKTYGPGGTTARPGKQGVVEHLVFGKGKTAPALHKKQISPRMNTDDTDLQS